MQGLMNVTYGLFTAPAMFQQVTALAQTGDQHIAVFDQVCVVLGRPVHAWAGRWVLVRVHVHVHVHVQVHSLCVAIDICSPPSRNVQLTTNSVVHSHVA
jgi:hypothetical protein